MGIIKRSHKFKLLLPLDIRVDLAVMAVMEVAHNAHTHTGEAADLLMSEVPAHTELQAPALTNLVPDNQPGVVNIELHELNQFKFHIYESSKEGFLTTLFFCLFTSTNIERKKQLFHNLPA